MDTNRNINIISFSLMFITVSCLLSCKSIQGKYQLPLNCGSSRIEFISDNEFLQKNNLGPDFHSNWEFGYYVLRDKKISIEYKPIPRNKKYKSKNSFNIIKTSTENESVELEIQGLKSDSTKIDYFSVSVLNENTNKIEAGDISNSNSKVNLKVLEELIPCRLICRILGGNQIEIRISEKGKYLINLYFDDSPEPTYNNRIGLKGVLLMGKDDIGDYVEFYKLNGQRLDSKMNRYYK